MTRDGGCGYRVFTLASLTMAESASEPPFLRIGPEAPASPVVLSVPHAGRDYSPALLAAARLPRMKLEALEDPLVDRLVWRALGLGAVALVARSPRAEIDLNRDERELDPGLVIPSPHPRTLLASDRMRGGLGLIPSRIGAWGAVWQRRLPEAEVARRIETIHRPYHAALDEALKAARERFGVAVLLDCHSMPPRQPPRTVVLGDRHGASIAADYLQAALAAVSSAGMAVTRNAPYAGGYITARHGLPDTGIHALQIEIDRSLYLAPDMRTPGPGFDATARMLAAVTQAVTDAVLTPDLPVAAE